MNRLEHLPEIAGRELGGLNADERLHAKILNAATEPTRAPRIRWRPVLASCVAIVLCLSLGLWGVPHLLPASVTGVPVMSSRTAGGDAAALSGGSLRAMDVPAGSVSVGGTTQAGSMYRNLFAQERNGNYPLIIADGAIYRMLISPTDMDTSLLGESLGEVTEYTLEPALSNGGIVSNVVFAGDTVYAVQGMKGAMAAAYVNGGLRVFQRVSFAGSAVLDSETLADTLIGSHTATAMELTDSGIVDDPATAQSLMQTLLDNAEYDSAASGTDGTRSLLISLDNGLLIQLMVGQDTLSACGTWSCPEFFDAYATAVSPS
jgi:hypothetical protein